MMYGEKRGVGCETVVVVAAVVRNANPATEQTRNLTGPV